MAQYTLTEVLGDTLTEVLEVPLHAQGGETLSLAPPSPQLGAGYIPGPSIP